FDVAVPCRPRHLPHELGHGHASSSAASSTAASPGNNQPDPVSGAYAPGPSYATRSLDQIMTQPVPRGRASGGSGAGASARSAPRLTTSSRSGPPGPAK